MISRWTQTEIGDAFGLKEHTIREIRQKYDYDTEQIHIMEEVVEKLRLGRDVKIWKLLMLGYSNAKCGEIYGLDESTIRKDIREKLQTQFIPIQNSYYKDKKTIEQINEFNHLDEITAWAIVLKEKDDLERQEKVTLCNQISRYVETLICMESTARIECRIKTLYISKNISI